MKKGMIRLGLIGLAVWAQSPARSFDARGVSLAFWLTAIGVGSPSWAAV